MTQMKKSALAARIVFVCVAAAGAAIDLATKAAFFNRSVAMTGNGPQHIIIPNFFNITSAGNPGGVFGMLAGSTWTLVGMAALALLAVGMMLVKIDGKQMWMHIALGLVLGGAIGNLYDRILYPPLDGLHVVRDFLDFTIFGWRYPTFNMADAFICVGAAMIFLKVLFGGPAWGKAVPKAAAQASAAKAAGRKAGPGAK